MPSWTELKPKVVTAALSAVLFFIVSNPLTYKLVDSLVAPIFGRVFKVAESSGCPTGWGLFFHTAVFFAATIAVTYV